MIHCLKCRKGFNESREQHRKETHNGSKDTWIVTVKPRIDPNPPKQAAPSAKVTAILDALDMAQNLNRSW